MIRALFALLLLVVAVPSALAAEPPPVLPKLGEAIGHVTMRRAPVEAINPALERSLTKDSLIFEKDVIQVGGDGYATITFLGGGELRIGPYSRLLIERVVGRKKHPREIFITLLEGGAVRFIPAAGENTHQFRLSIKTPVGTSTGKGADFWVGRFGTTYGVLLYKGSLEVASLAGARLFDKEGQGIKLQDISAIPPEPVYFRPRQIAEIEKTVEPRADGNQ